MVDGSITGPGGVIASVPPDIGYLAACDRQYRFVALLHRLAAVMPSHARSIGAVGRAFGEMRLPLRIERVRDPLLRIWMSLATQLTGAAAGGDDYDVTGRNLAEDLFRLDRRAVRPPEGRLRCGIPIVRSAPDELLALVAPPTYEFGGVPRETAYTLDVFAHACDTAVARVTHAWPAVGRDLTEYVRLLVHVPGARFRSASAARYSGIVFLSSWDESVLEMEESLVHELAHQVLYDFVETGAILVEDPGEEFVLPWSRTTRDLYGFLHACWVYAALALYYRRVEGGSAVHTSLERERAGTRCEAILSGLAEAVPMLDGLPAGTLTPAGDRVRRDVARSALAIMR